MTSASTDVPVNSQTHTIALTVMMLTVTIGNALVGTLSFSGNMGRRVLPNDESHQGLLRVKAVLGLVPDRRLRPIENVFRDLLAVVGGKAVEDDCIRACSSDEFSIDAEAGQILQPLVPLILLAHRGPHVRVEDVRALDCTGWIVDELDGASGSARDLYRLVVRPVSRGSRSDERHAELGRC